MANSICPKCGSSNTVVKENFLRWMKKPNANRICLDCKNKFNDNTLPKGFKVDKKFE